MIDVKDLIGVPYKIHGRDKDGMDCWGFLMECILRSTGISLPDFFYEETGKETCDKLKIISEGLPFKRVQSPCENCIIVMNVKGYESHVAFYLGEGMIAHSIRGLGGVCEPLRRYEKRITGYYKVGE